MMVTSLFKRVFSRKGITLFLVATLLLYLILSLIGAIFIMQVPRLPLEKTPISINLAYDDVTFLSRHDDILLQGWYIPGEANEVIMIIHGGFQNRIDDNVGTLGLSLDLHNQGFNLLLFDLRGRGKSDGTGKPLSYIENDIGGAVDYLGSKGFPSEDISIIGYCSGAAAACIFAAQEDLGSLVLVGCFAEIDDMVVRMGIEHGIPDILTRMFIPGLRLMTKIIFGFNVVNPIDVVSYVDCPILFIHEEYDEFIPTEDMLRLFRASTNPVNELWDISGVTHSQAYWNSPDVFIGRITDFINKADFS